MLHLKQTERDQIRSELSESQNKFLNDFLKRGKKTGFANELAKSKANSDSKEDIAAEWELVDYLDAGSSWMVDSQLYCECGRKLRYQYIIRNLKTESIKKFGETHFEEHTGIPPQLANKILKGFEKIDYELDEILLKIRNNWTLSVAGLDDIPKSIAIPLDIQAHLDVNIPLLERQVNRLRGEISTLLFENQRRSPIEDLTSFNRERFNQIRTRNKELEKIVVQTTTELTKEKLEISKTDWWRAISSSSSLERDLQLGIIVYLKGKDTVIASEICKYLIDNHGAPNDRRQSGNYEIFPDVCIFLEDMVGMERIKFLKRFNGLDSLYDIVDPFLLKGQISTLSSGAK